MRPAVLARPGSNMTELCFICAVKIGRGNRSEVSQQKMDKLVSVQRTVDHSRQDSNNIK